MSLNFRAVYTIAKKEFSDNARNKWIISMITIFLVLTIVASIMAGHGKLGELEGTVGALMSISVMLVPIIAIMLGYATISGEAESGALSIVLTCPVSRVDVLLGKFLGLGSVICFSVLVGFGSSGLIVAATAGGAQWSAYLVFMLLTMLLGMLYLSLSICFSSVLKRRVTSLAAGVVVFFLGMILGMIVMGVYMSSGGDINAFITGDMSAIPDWFWFEVFVSPQDGSGVAAMLAFGVDKYMGYEFDLPSWINLGTLALAQLVWTLIPLALAFVWFLRRDV
jgi:ABC-type transport system involved in multi-copper enzyme maturation permease subunit